MQPSIDYLALEKLAKEYLDTFEHGNKMVGLHWYLAFKKILNS